MYGNDPMPVTMFFQNRMVGVAMESFGRDGLIMKVEFESEITSLEDLIKVEMTVRNTDVTTAGAYRIKWTSYQSSRFDSTRFKKDLAELAAAYTKTTIARRFSSTKKTEHLPQHSVNVPQVQR